MKNLLPKLAVRLSHANIVPVFDLGKVEPADGGTTSYFIAMEYVAGMDLATLLSRARRRSVTLPIGLCVYIVAEIAKDNSRMLATFRNRGFEIQSPMAQDVAMATKVLG